MKAYCDVEFHENPRAAPVWAGLQQLPETLVEKLDQAPVAGCNSQTLVRIAGRACLTLLDSGATTSSIPEELVADIFNRISARIRNKEFEWQDLACPIRRFENYSRDPRKIEGLVKDRPISVTHNVILRVMFVPIGAQSGPVRAIRVKIVPKGTSFFPGIILSAPCLSPAPEA